MLITVMESNRIAHRKNTCYIVLQFRIMLNLMKGVVGFSFMVWECLKYVGAEVEIVCF